MEKIKSVAIRRVTQDLWGMLALFGLVCLNYGFVLTVAVSKGVAIPNIMTLHAGKLFGPTFLFLGFLFTVSSVFVYKRGKRKQTIICCTENEELDEFEYNQYVIAARAMIYDENNLAKSSIQSEELPPNFRVVDGNNLYINGNGQPLGTCAW